MRGMQSEIHCFTHSGHEPTKSRKCSQSRKRMCGLQVSILAGSARKGTFGLPAASSPRDSVGARRPRHLPCTDALRRACDSAAAAQGATSAGHRCLRALATHAACRTVPGAAHIGKPMYPGTLPGARRSGWNCRACAHARGRRMTARGAPAGSGPPASSRLGAPPRTASAAAGAERGRSTPSDDAGRSAAAASDALNPRAQPGLAADELPPPSPAEAGLVPGPPPSWVPALAVTRERMDLRCPRGGRLVLYARAQAELFAWFGECARWDGMVQRVTVFEARARAAPPRLFFGLLHHAPATAHAPLRTRSRRRWSHACIEAAAELQECSHHAVSAAVPTRRGDRMRPAQCLFAQPYSTPARMAPRLRLSLEGCAAVAPDGASGAAQRPAAPRRRTTHGRSCARCASSTAAGATACASAARARARAARRRPLVRPRPLARACSGARPCPGSALGPDCSMGPLPLALLHPPPQCRMPCRMTYATDKTPSMQPGLTRARGRRRGRGGRAAQHGRGARRAQRGDLLCGRAPGRAAAPRRAGLDPTLPYPTLCRSGAPYQSRSNTQPMPHI